MLMAGNQTKIAKDRILIIKRPLLDRWILSRLSETYRLVDKELSKYNSYKATGAIEDFVRDLSTWYLRLTRKRRDEAFYQTMYNIFSKFILYLVSIRASYIRIYISEFKSQRRFKGFSLLEIY